MASLDQQKSQAQQQVMIRLAVESLCRPKFLSSIGLPLI